MPKKEEEQQKYYRSDGTEYDPSLEYYFTDKDGNQFTAGGQNGYVWQAVTEGLPISINEKGEWYIEPYLDVTSDGKLIAHTPDWFKNTSEYEEWQNYYNQIQPGINADTFGKINDILKSYGAQSAFRVSFGNMAKSYGITDADLQNKFVDDYAAMYSEGEGAGDAKIKLYGDENGMSAADIAREFKDGNISKEDLSRAVLAMQATLESNRRDGWSGSREQQEAVLNALTILNLLNYVDDNPDKFGEEGEFNGLLQASGWQKVYSLIEANNTQLLGGIASGPARLVHGLLSWAFGKDHTFDTRINQYADFNTDPNAGAGLEGREGFIQVGNFSGAIENFVVTYGASMLMGAAVQGFATSLSGSASTALSALGSFMQKPIGSGIADFLLNDIPIDLLNFFNVASEEGFEEAWASKYETQKLIPIPFIGGIGWDMSAGLRSDLVTDVVMDLSIPVLGLLNSVIMKNLDGVTNGATTRFKEHIKTKVAIQNLKMQERATRIPVIGTAWKKMVNAVMGAENAAFIREARKTAIVDGSLDWYKIAHNVLTLKNHGGAEEVAKLYEALLKKNGVLASITDFQKKAKSYGGVGKVQVNWKSTKGGTLSNLSRTVDDILPKQVKQGLLDVERLAELKGKQMKDPTGGLVVDPKMEKEIQELQKRVDNLPTEIKQFADNFSQANKDLEKIGVQLGITNADWQKAMELDPEFEKYMVRQSLVPDGDPRMERVGSDDKQAILKKSRTGAYDADKMLDPFISLNMKASALGRAFAWNQQAKTLVAMQNAQGKIIAGKSGIDTAKKLKEVKDQIANVDLTRNRVHYDEVLSKFSTDAKNISTTIGEVNKLLNLPSEISLKSIYSIEHNPAIQSLVSDFEAGNVKFGEGVKAKAGLADADAAYMIKNTYHIVSTAPDGSQTASIMSYDNVPRVESKQDYIGKNLYNAGVTPDGVAYRYTVKDGVITDIKEITEPKAMAETISGLGGVHTTTPEAIRKMGVSNARALNRTILFYRDNIPNLPIGSDFRIKVNRKRRVMGWIPGILDTAEYKWRIENGHVTGTLPVYVSEGFYLAGKEKALDTAVRNGELSGFHPKGSGAPESIFIHENGHSLMAKLAVCRVNAKIDAGKLDVNNLTTSLSVAMEVEKEWDALNEAFAKKALKDAGISYNGKRDFYHKWQNASDSFISEYAGGPAYKVETYSEALVDFWGHPDTASKYTMSIIESMRAEAQKYSMAVNPRQIMKENGLELDPKMFKGDNYNFPANAKSNTQKAKWLSKKRAENPYLNVKGVLTEDQYKKANLWDTYFKKEIESYDPSVKTASPDKLIEKNGEFLENLNKNVTETLLKKLKDASVEGFDSRLAAIALGQNKTDAADLLDDFIVTRVNKSAEDIAKNMFGGVNEDNLNRARITLYQDETVKRDMVSIISSMSPDLSQGDVAEKVERLFKQQAEGLATYEALGVNYKNLNEEYIKLKNELHQSNKYAVGKGKTIDKELRKNGFLDDSTQVIHYREGGEDVYVVVNDPVTASILKRPDDFKKNGTTTNGLVYTANAIARMYRLGTTGINPISLLKNVLRDPVQAAVTAGFNPLTMNLDPQSFYKTLRQYGLDDATINTVTSRLFEWSSRSSMTNEIRHLGGETPGTVGYHNRIEKFNKDFNKFADNKLFNALEAPMEMWESTLRNQIAQQSFEKAMKRTGGDVEKSMASAMFDASNATTNFSHSIFFMRRATASIPYLSAAVNGTTSFWRLFNIDPIGMIGRLTAGFMVPVMAITAWNLGSEERRKQYLNLPEWYRDSNIVLVGNDGNIFAVPIPDEISQFSGTVRRLIEYTNDASPMSIPSILAQGAFGFSPVDLDGYFSEDGSLDLKRGTFQLASTIMPQAFQAIYEVAFKEKLYTGEDISDYSTLNSLLNLGGNIFGSGWFQVWNDFAFIIGASDKELVGRTTIEQLSRNLFGMGFNDAKAQFMKMVGKPGTYDEKTNKMKGATGLFKESEELQAKISSIDMEIAREVSESKKEELEKEKQKLIKEFCDRVGGLAHNYMELFSVTGGLELWQRKKLIQILAIGTSISSAAEGTYQEANADQTAIENYALGRQRYLEQGLEGGPTIDAIGYNKNGNLNKSLELQAAIDSYYGAPKQASQDYKNAIEQSGIKDIRNEFYNAISAIYDEAEARGEEPDYDLIEKIQARYLQSVDSVLIPIINRYGISVLNNNDFVNAVRSQVNGMIPSDDWKQSRRNAKKFLSKKDFPTATVDVEKWLVERYSTSLRNRNLDSDPEVTQMLNEIKTAIDNGEMGVAKGKIESLKNGYNKSNYYISAPDLNQLNAYYNMVK